MKATLCEQFGKTERFTRGSRVAYLLAGWTWRCVATIRHSKLYIRMIACDPAKAEYLRQRLQGRGVRVEDISTSSPTTQKRIVDTLIERFVTGSVDIPNHATLVRDLKGLRLEMDGRGYKAKPSTQRDGSHGDVGMAFCYGLLHCNRQSICVWDEADKKDYKPVERTPFDGTPHGLLFRRSSKVPHGIHLQSRNPVPF